MFSKSKSSSKLIYLILGLLISASLFFTFSGAWFTASASTTKSGTSATFVLGNFGDVSISANNYIWKDSSNNNIYPTAQAKNTANDATGIVRDKVMPGDKVQSGSITMTFDALNTSTYPKAYYLIKTGNNYYTINNSNALVQTSTTAGVIDSQETKTINGSIVSITENNQTKYLDGSTSSASIGNTAQGQALTDMGASVGTFSLTAGGITYYVAVIQYPNLTATTAFDQLVLLF